MNPSKQLGARSLRGLLLLSTLALLDCTPTVGSVGCIPGEQVTCPCAGGSSGVQRCLSDFTFGVCSCNALEDAGPGADSAIDAAASGFDPVGTWESVCVSCGPSVYHVEFAANGTVDLTTYDAARSWDLRNCATKTVARGRWSLLGDMLSLTDFQPDEFTRSGCDDSSRNESYRGSRPRDPGLLRVVSRGGESELVVASNDEVRLRRVTSALQQSPLGVWQGLLPAGVAGSSAIQMAVALDGTQEAGGAFRMNYESEQGDGYYLRGSWQPAGRGSAVVRHESAERCRMGMCEPDFGFLPGSTVMALGNGREVDVVVEERTALRLTRVTERR